MMVGMKVLCGYTVWSAYKAFGSVDGAVMIEVMRPSDIVDEFGVRMRELIASRSLGLPSPSRWHLRWYLPYSGEPTF